MTLMTGVTIRIRGARLPACGLVAGAALLAACTTTSSVSSGPPASHPAAVGSPSMHIPCSQIKALGASLSSLSAAGTRSASQLSSELTKIEGQLKALGGQANGPFASQESQLTAALNQVKSAMHGLTGGSPSAAALTALATALAGLKKTVQPMIAEIQAACGT
jgi:hypothetical protein